MTFLMLAALVLVGCGKDESDTLTIAMEASGDIPEKFEAQLEEFTAETGIEVELQYYSSADAYNQMILGSASTGDLPDIIWTNSGYQLEEYVESGLVVPIDEYIQGDLSNYHENLLAGFYVDDQLYGLPKDYNTTVMYYNTNLVGQTPTTEAEFNTYMTDNGSDSAALVIDPKINYIFPFLLSNGVEVFDENGDVNYDALTSQEHIDFLNKMKQYFDSGELVTPYSVGAGWDGEVFANQTASAIYGGSWIEGVIEFDGAQAALLPTADQNAMLYTAGWAVTKDCENPEDAVALIEWLNEDEQIEYGIENGLIGLPPTKSSQAALEESGNEFYATYFEAVEYGYDFNSINPEYIDIYNKQIEEVLYNNKDVTEAVNTMAEEMKEVE